MLNIEDKSCPPTVPALRDYAACALFSALCDTMERSYQAAEKIEYSGDKVLPGWNLKFKKAGRTLCTVYPRPGRFTMLLVVGQRERARVEAMLPTCSETFRRIYEATPEGMGQRWLLLEFAEYTPLFDDALKMIRFRREREPSA